MNRSDDRVPLALRKSGVPFPAMHNMAVVAHSEERGRRIN